MPDLKIDWRRPVWVHRELRTRKLTDPPLYNVRQDGRLRGQVEELLLHDVQFVVRSRGWIQYLKTGQCNPHAFAVGLPVRGALCSHGLALDIRYNGKTGNFETIASGMRLKGAKKVMLNARGMTAAEGLLKT